MFKVPTLGSSVLCSTEFSSLFLVVWAGMGRDGSGLASREEEGSSPLGRQLLTRAAGKMGELLSNSAVKGRRSQLPLHTVTEDTCQAFGSLGSPAFLGWCIPMLEMFPYRDTHVSF